MESKLSQSRLDHVEEVWHRSRQPKLALKEVEKWMKKQKDHPRLELLRAFLLFDCQRFEDSKTQFDRILNRKPPIDDISMLQQLQELAWRQQMNAGATESTTGANHVSLWNQAVMRQNDKIEALLVWYAVSIRCGHWGDAQRVMAILRKENPRDKNYHFSYIAVCYVVSEVSSAVNAKLSALNKTLALRFLQASVDQTKSDPDGNTSITSRQDLALLQRIFERHGRHADLLAIFEDDDLKLKHKFLYDKQEFGRIKMDLLFHAKLWGQLFDFSKQVISNEFNNSEVSPVSEIHFRPNRAVYESLFEAGDHLSRRFEILEILTSSLDERAPSREHVLAIVSWYAKIEGTDTLHQLRGSHHPSSFSEACSFYFETYGSKPCCFEDLKNYVERLAADERLAFLERIDKISSHTHADQTAQVCLHEKLNIGDDSTTDTWKSNPKLSRWISLESNRLMFHFLCATYSTEPRKLQATLSEMLKNCYDLLNLGESNENGCLTTIATLSVTTLLKLHSIQSAGDSTLFSEQRYLIQATCLLEKLGTLLPEDRQIYLLKLRVYSLLGVPKLALSEYQKLDVKDILNDTLSHEVYTRISGYQPFPLGSSGSHVKGDDSLHSLCKALDFYNQWEQDLTDFLLQVRDLQVHGTFLDVVDMMDKRRGSFTWRLLLIEKRRMARIRDQERDLGDLGDIGIWLDHVLDQRAFDTIPNLESTQSPYYRDEEWRGPKTSTYWLATRILNDDTLNVATGQATFNAIDIAQAESMMKDATDDQRKELSAAERLVEDGWISLRQLVKHIFGPGPETRAPQISELLTNVTQALDTLAACVIVREDYESRLPGWDGLERIYTAYEFCKACQYFYKSKRISGSAIISRHHIDILGDTVRQTWGSVAKRVRLWMDAIRNGGQNGLFDQAVGGETGELLRKFVSDDQVTVMIGKYCESILEALEGGLELK